MSVLEAIELDTIIANIRKIALENPDYIYPPRKFKLNENRCDYERDGEASCLIAKALFAAGVPVAELIAFDQRNDGDISAILYHPNGVFDDEGNIITGRFIDDVIAETKIAWINHVQECQDQGYTWSQAVDAADRRIPLAA